MRVKELIEKLARCSGDMEIIYSSRYGNFPIYGIAIDEITEDYEIIDEDDEDDEGYEDEEITSVICLF